MISPTFIEAREALHQTRWIQTHGRVQDVIGTIVRSAGPNARVGDLCSIESGDTAIPAEVIGFKGSEVLLMPLDGMEGVRAGCTVRATHHVLRAPVGEQLLGRVVDGLGYPMDKGTPLDFSHGYPLTAMPPSAMERTMIERPFSTGVRAIDGMLTIGIGQRMGIFAGSGVGKSTLLGMIARNGDADVNVIALVGERGREVREFIENDLGPQGLRKSVIVCATSDQSPLQRIKAAFTATAMAEYFRDRGANVMLMMDSITRFCMAQREVGLAAGEPPSAKGYTPSVFALLPKLLERAGNSDRGSITGIYTVLVDGDDTNEPISDAVRSILDGHILLSRKLTSAGHYPPIDVLHSLSRTMPMVVSPSQLDHARDIRELMAAYNDIEDLVNIGAYKAGANPLADRAVEKWDSIKGFLRQDKSGRTEFPQTLTSMQDILL